MTSQLKGSGGNQSTRRKPPQRSWQLSGQLSHIPWQGFEPLKMWEVANNQWQRLAPLGYQDRPLIVLFVLISAKRSLLATHTRNKQLVVLRTHNEYHFLYKIGG